MKRGFMPDYWIKISETEDEEVTNHHYLITATDERKAKNLAMKFMERFIDDDDHPETIDNGFSFHNNGIFVRLSQVKETTKEQFKNFLLKIHTINLS